METEAGHFQADEHSFICEAAVDLDPLKAYAEKNEDKGPDEVQAFVDFVTRKGHLRPEDGKLVYAGVQEEGCCRTTVGTL